MPRRGFRIGSVIALLLLAAFPVGWAEEAAPPVEDEAVVVMKRGGTRFLSLPDWPIAEKGGVRTVAPLEDYLSLKFGRVQSRFDAGDQRVEALERRLEALQTKQEKLQEQVQDLAQQIAEQEVTDGDTAQNAKTSESASQ